MTLSSTLITEQDQSGAPLFLLKTPSMEVRISGLGATIRSILIFPVGSPSVEITQGFDSDLLWLDNKLYFGSTVGRVANRIGRAHFTLNGTGFPLEANDGENHLHGGSQGFHARLWQGKLWQTAEEAGIDFTLTSEDGDGGYPGRVEVRCRMSLSAKNVLKTVYTAISDRPTPLNLTNHVYFNLGGAEHTDVLDHVFWTKAEAVLQNSTRHVPDGTLLPVEGNAFDFRVPKAIGRDLASVSGGYDHCFVLERHNKPLKKVVEVARATFGGSRTLRFSTDQSSFQFYSGNYLTGVPGRNGKPLMKHAAFCVESQRFPDTVNHPEWASIVVTPTEPYRHEFHYGFEF